MNKDRVVIDISLWAVFKFIIALVLIGLLFYLREILILVFIAFILAAGIEPTVTRLKKKKVPRALSILAIFILILAFLVLLFDMIIPPLAQQVSIFIEDLPRLINDVGTKFFPNSQNLTDDLSGQAVNYIKNYRSLPSGVVSGAYGAALNIFSFFMNTLVVMVITFYLLLEKDGVGRGFFKYLPLKRKEKIIDIFTKITVKLSSWLKGQLILSGFIGFITYIVLLAIGIDLALALSLFAALMELVPVVGPLIALVPAALIALTISPATALIVLIAYLVIQQIENNILVPQIMKKALGLSPLVVIISILVGAKLLGLIGILLAVPMLSALTVIFEELYGKKKRAEGL